MTPVDDQGVHQEMDRAIAALHRRLDQAQTGTDLARGRPYPTRRAPFFPPYMPLAELYRFPTQHVEFPRSQLTLRPTGRGPGG